MRLEQSSGGWRRQLRREVGWLLLAKLGALLVLWGLFFSAAHRVSIDGPTTANRLAVQPESSTVAAPATETGEQSHD